MHQIKVSPVLVIGTGISGLFTALKIAQQGQQVLLITKSGLAENNSLYAQGGIAAVIPDNVEDSIELHVQDTLKAGAGLCQEEAVRSILSDGFAAIEDLLAFGVPFDRNADNQLALTKEAAHSTRRIIHAGGDATGHSVEMALIDKVHQNPLIEVMEYCQVLELLCAGERVYGCIAVSLEAKEQWTILSEYTVLATGGIGQIYRFTTNPKIATGDGISLAHRSGAAIGHMEFVQFHPTAFYANGKVHFLISEALRGEGALLVNHHGESFAKRYHPDAELAPRDVLTRAIYSELQNEDTSFVYLDISHLDDALIEQRFPTILANCLKHGVDIRRDKIPVTPAAHYMMGGVAVDELGQTNLESLYAVGEAAYTGLHGANRLASNSLLECVVLARRVADTIHAQCQQKEIGNLSDAEMRPESELWINQNIELPEPLDLTPRVFHFENDPEIESRLEQLHALMWNNVGIVRTEKRLAEAIEKLDRMETEAYQNNWGQVIPQGIEYLNQLQVSRLIAEASWQRQESIGAHFRKDETSIDSSKVLVSAGLRA
ncbi:MAG: L-aspartate oxidase [Cyanobacteria bacterium]|nr:L-aspartate oxidase [Cyanobacteriota bacterium]